MQSGCGDSRCGEIHGTFMFRSQSVFGLACIRMFRLFGEMEAGGQEGGLPGASQGARPSNKRLQQTQAQVDEVVGIMKVNVEKVLERDQKLSQLDDRADALQEGASQFEKSAATLKRKYWWKNIKMIIIMCAIVVILIIIIIVWAGNK
ncbi:Synaptobrevin [Onchocerca flexuosa]|uniref:Synaptobrevin-1 n=1 Tax=Onchocerca flexuosa TaxID=387005 RepID=A0A238C439_9BILA|nr:Synaptobrevin [Onchocerca flexuosa]